jgi:hypothetical protein
MRTTLKKSALLGLGLALLAGGAGAMAQEQSGKSYVLEDGTVHATPGEMFQHLRTRDIDGFAAGNPKDIVEAYPEEFENVGDLIHEKRVTE